MAIKKDKPRALGELLPKLEGRASASVAAWRQHVEKHARRGESWEEADARLRREMEAARANPSEAQEKEAAETPAQLFLPGMTEVMRAMPNHIARSSLFAPVARGRKKMHDNTILVSRSDAVIRFRGKQLDEAQADVWMQAIHEAMKHPLGEEVVINRADFLRKIGRNTSGKNYKWLDTSMEDLTFGMLIIDIYKQGKRKLSIGQSHALHLISGYVYDAKTDNYKLQIDPRWKLLYENKEFALIDWDKRLQFGQRQDIAKNLQRLIAASSDKEQRYNLQWLKEKMEYNSPIRKFRETMASACEELKRLKIIISWDIEDSRREQEQLVLNLPKTHEK